MGAVSGRFALYATDTQGACRAIELERHLDRADLFVRIGVCVTLPDFVCSFRQSVQSVLNAHLHRYECHVVFLRSGQTGWRLASVLPPKASQCRVLVIAVDMLAGICLPVCGEHEAGRLHQLTEQIAWLLGLQSVLSFPGLQDDVQQCLLSSGLRHGWTLEPESVIALQRVSTALSRKRPVAWVQTAGVRPVLPLALAGEVIQHDTTDTLNPDAYDALVLVSDRCDISEKLIQHNQKTLVWRPRNLIVGVYCHRDTPLEVIGQGVVQCLDNNGLSINSVRYLAGLELQRHHPALNDFGIIHGIPLLTYRIEELLGADSEQPLALMKRLWESGHFPVADAAARHCSGAATTLVPESTFCLQTDGPSVSMAICRIPESHMVTLPPQPKVVDGRRLPAAPGSRHQVVVCSGERCTRVGSCHQLADYVRRLARELRLDQGARQIHVASSVCCVACRYKNSVAIHECLASHENRVNDGVHLRGVHNFSRIQWQQILRAINRRQPLKSLVALNHLVPAGID